MFKKLLLGLGIAWFLGLGSIAIVNWQSNFDDTSGFGTNHETQLEFELLENDKILVVDWLML